MTRFTISTMAVVLGLAVAATAQAGNPGGSSSGKGSGKSGGPHVSSSQMHAKSHTSGSNVYSMKHTPKDFHKANPKFHDKSYFKHFTHKWWCADFGCYCYWSPLDGCYFFWYEPFGCYCPYDYLAVAYPTVVMTSPAVVVPETVTTIVVTPGVKTVLTPVVKTGLPPSPPPRPFSVP